MTFVACYVIVVGLSMIGQWTFFVTKKQVPELATEPLRISFHWAGEFVTAASLLASGSALLANAEWALEVSLVSLGMLLYTVIVSPGYFAQKRQWPLVSVFAVLLVLTLVSSGLVIREG